MKSFHNKVAAITGAASGIGRALAIDLASQGCHLSLADLNTGELEKTAELARLSGVTVTTAKLDVSDRDAIYAWAEQTVADHDRVNLIFNNAGVALGASIEGASDEDLHWIMDINYWGVVHGTRAFLPHLRASGDGHIINISSIFGIVAVPSQGAYNATKFAVRGFTECLRQELEISKAPVSATCVHPGGIKTNIAKSARFDEDAMKDLTGGKSAAQSKARFEKMFTTTPETAARTILNGVKHNSRRVLIGSDAKVVDLTQRLLPSTYQRVVSTFTKLSMR
ncbi:SDR family oxidoreductase [Sinimarinibacterium sp. NLF-5-8]|uniref:SDR family NAD(P)-dependent oxidoreductase n=1 Tax=Sinimarinibacterium sp. NLF-5-8 TaxID=2698684 RepID=UPI00137BA69F|nr:SDR family NAD(P)-dependent oxidoreductase [Sinimarinibacterium sp. NLF-5-8]QHS09360.1 SDR family NAD(P)-dependent oxidoreductase [Sinimarinibacterium sp. NLF-5-8]